jgi:hypothetical protein
MKLNMNLIKVMINALRREWRYLSELAVQDVPEGLTFCEFVCRKERCSAQEWATCERRLKRGAGEFMPVNG